MNENVNVCITPKGEKPVLHFSQFDNERVFTVTVLADDGESAAVLTGLDIEFRIRKTDSHVVTIAPESVADNVITFKTTEQLCACCGQNIASVVLMKDDMVISTLDILVDIQRDILSGGLTSESDIRNLTRQIEQIVPEVVGDDYYNKQEVDDLLAEHTFDPTNYYDKQEVDDLLSDKADKSAIASLIVQKDVAKAPIASFNTDLAEALTKIIVGINPVQAGSGTPSPDNVRPISGHTEANIVRCGVNWLPLKFYKGLEYNSAIGNTFGTEEATDGTVSGNTVSFNIGSWGRKCMLSPKLPTGIAFRLTMTVTSSARELNYTEFYLDKDLKVTRKYNIQNSGTSRTVNAGFTLNDNECYIAIELGCNNPATIVFDSPMLNVGSTAIAYTPYNGQTATVNFGQTVYGGSLDVTSGVLTVTHAYIASYNGEKINEPWISSLDEYIPNTTPTNGAEVVYELATPLTVQLSPNQIGAIVGQNNVYGDTNGDTAVRFTETIGNELGV